MVRLIIFLFAFQFAGCAESPLQKDLSGATAVSVKFYTAGGAIEKTVETDNEDAIANMARFIDSKAEKDMKCPFDGYVEFIYPQMGSRTVQFSLDPKCKQFITEIDGQVSAFQMSEEAYDFFTALRKGQAVY